MDHLKKNDMNGGFFECENQHFPIEIIWEAEDEKHTVRIVDSRNTFIPPARITEKKEEILSTYKDSIIFDNECIRLKNYEFVGNELTLYTERTRYFFTLITNRRMDFILDNHQSIREIFESKHKMSALIDSRMSNHIGFSVLIKTEDHCLTFAIRNKRVSTKKNTFDCAVSGSLKSKYVLSNEGTLTVESFFDAISQEIIDELHLPSTNTVRLTERDLIALYRDNYEGGKPNLIFFYNISYTSRELHSFVCESCNDTMVMDLDRLLTINQSSFINATIQQENILIRFCDINFDFPLSPNTGGVLAYFREYIKKKERK